MESIKKEEYVTNEQLPQKEWKIEEIFEAHHKKIQNSKSI